MSEIAASAVRTSRVLITENATVGHVPVACGEPRRQYLTEREVDQLIKSAEKRGRYGKRDGMMILIAYRHGLRRSELVGLRWRDVDLAAARLHVIRCKGGDDSVHELNERELRGLGRLRKQQEPGQAHVFVSERGSPFTGDGFDKILRRAAAAIGMDDVADPTGLVPLSPALVDGSDGRGAGRTAIGLSLIAPSDAAKRTETA